MITDDLVSLVQTLCPEVHNVVNEQIRRVRQPVDGVYIAQRATTGRVLPTIQTDILFADIVIRGAGMGEVGRNNAWATADRLYKALQLVTDREINGTRYIRVTPDSSPFEVVSDDGNTDVQFGIEIVRWYGA